MKLRLQVAGLLASCGPSALDESGFEPRCGFAHAGGAPLARTLIVSRAQAGPGDQVPSGREAAHAAADLGTDDTSAQFVDAGNGDQEVDGGAKGLDLSVDLLIDGGDRHVDGVDLLQMDAQQKAVMPGDAPAQRSSGDALIRRCASWASCSGSLSPAIKASIILRPDKPITSEMTESSLMLASSRVFCSRWTWRLASRTSCLRVRNRSRISWVC